MALPRDQYDDPAKIAERNEELSIGCAGCENHQLTRNRGEYECIKFVPGYPDKTNKDCAKWRKRQNRRYPI